MTLSPEEFVKRWQASSSVAELARELGIDENNIYQRALRYRKKGIPLKRHYSNNHHRALDVEHLKRLAIEHGK